MIGYADSIHTNMENKSSEELLEIWVANNRYAWSHEAFHAIQEILVSRNVTLPEQRQSLQPEVDNEQRSATPPPRIGGAIAALRLSSVIYFCIGIACTLFAFAAHAPGSLLLLGVVCFAFTWPAEMAISLLKQGRRSGWLLGVGLGALYTPSGFIFLGIPILLSLLKGDVQRSTLRNSTPHGRN